jgi:hypothetical protein
MEKFKFVSATIYLKNGTNRNIKISEHRIDSISVIDGTNGGLYKVNFKDDTDFGFLKNDIESVECALTRKEIIILGDAQ